MLNLLWIDNTILTWPKKRSFMGKKCSGQTLSRYHSKLLHCSFSRSSSLDLIACWSRNLAASVEVSKNLGFNYSCLPFTAQMITYEGWIWRKIPPIRPSRPKRRERDLRREFRRRLQEKCRAKICEIDGQRGSRVRFPRFRRIAKRETRARDFRHPRFSSLRRSFQGRKSSFGPWRKVRLPLLESWRAPHWRVDVLWATLERGRTSENAGPN